MNGMLIVTYHRRCRRAPAMGFTLIEVLVVISIIGILIGLLIPAVMMAREAARKTRCVNNLRQIGIAMQGRVAESGHFPPGFGGDHYSYLTRLLPYLEEKALYDSINFKLQYDTAGGSANETVLMTQVDLFLCPSSPQISDQSGGKTNYAGNQGTDRIIFKQTASIRDYVSANDGLIISSQYGVAPREVTDGLSVTASVAEWVTAEMDKVFSTTLTPKWPEDYQPFAVACHNFNPAKDEVGPRVSSLGKMWTTTGLFRTTYNHVLPVNDNTCWSQGKIGAASAGSFHSGGANVLFADGHVQLIKQTISWPTWRALGTRNGREIVPSDAF